MKLITIIPSKLFQRGRFDKFSLEEKLVMLKDFNVGLVVCMIQPLDVELCGAVDMLHCPLPDSACAEFSAMERMVPVAVAMVRVGRAVLVHCNAGRNRSSLFSARMLMELTGLTGRQAVARMRALRPGALANVAFVKYLEAL